MKGTEGHGSNKCGTITNCRADRGVVVGNGAPNPQTPPHTQNRTCHGQHSTTTHGTRRAAQCTRRRRLERHSEARGPAEASQSETGTRETRGWASRSRGLGPQREAGGPPEEGGLVTGPSQAVTWRPWTAPVPRAHPMRTCVAWQSHVRYSQPRPCVPLEAHGNTRTKQRAPKPLTRARTHTHTHYVKEIKKPKPTSM